MIDEFFSEQPLNFEQVKSLTHALLAVARVDGVHDSEMRLIREFYDSCARDGDPALEEVAKGQFDVGRAKTLFDTPELTKLFTKSLILLAFADGVYAKLEDDLVRNYAGELGLSSEEVDHLHEATKEFLLSALSHIQNLDALKQVRRNLDPH